MAVLKDLIVHGASRFINVVQFDSTKGGIIAADKGVFNKLIATDAEIESLDVDDLNANTLTAQKATVVGLLDVKGELHTNQWTNANISNVGGSFYISPTVSTTIASNGTPMSITITGNANNRTVQVSGGAFVTDAVKIYSGNQISTASWAIGSHVMFTGTVRLSTSSVDYPLGTCVGYLTAALSSGGFTVGEVSSAALETIISELGTSNLKSYDIKISMFEIGPDTTLKPVGIMMTSYGVDRSTYIDIYGGVNVKNSTTGKVNPNLRIGYLGGLDSYIDSVNVSHQPVGWGIYTDNGYFKGTVVADSGTIGNFTIANDLHSGTSGIGQDTNVYISPGTISNIDIAGSLIEPYQLTQDTSPQSGKTYYQYNTQNETYTSVTGTISGNPKELGYYELVDTNRSWAFAAGNSFGVTTGGELFANGATINGIVNIKNGSNVYTIQQVEQTIYGTVAYQYAHDGITETVYKRDDNTYYWIDSNEEEHIVDEINLEHDEVTGKLITIRLEDGFNASVNQIQNAVNSNTELIQTLSDSVDGQFENINGQFISIDEQFTGQITDINQTISTQQEYINNLSGYVTITSNNIQVGNLANNSYVEIDGIDAKVSININDNEVAYMSGNRFYAPSAVVTNLYMKTEIGGNETGDIGWVMRSNGHLSLKRLK